MQKQRPPRGAGVPPQSGVPPESLDPSICAVDVSVSSATQRTDKKTTETRSRRRLGEASNSSTQEIEKYLVTTLFNSSRSGSA